MTRSSAAILLALAAVLALSPAVGRSAAPGKSPSQSQRAAGNTSSGVQLTAGESTAADSDVEAPPPSKTQQAMDSASKAQKFMFIVFWQEKGAEVDGLMAKVKALRQELPEHIAWAKVNVDDEAEATIIKRYNVSRAPMPMVLVVAPNGAITGGYAKELTDEQIDEALVTPTMMVCMKALQMRKLVLVRLHTDGDTELPAGAADFVADPHYAKRTVVVPLDASDRAEARFLSDLQVDPDKEDVPAVALLAPPGVLVAKFTANVAMQDMTARLHAAGKCCDDPNCKHKPKSE
jgi:hypothetical protein